jgi:hypothetical protein
MSHFFVNLTDGDLFNHNNLTVFTNKLFTTLFLNDSFTMNEYPLAKSMHVNALIDKLYNNLFSFLVPSKIILFLIINPYKIICETQKEIVFFRLSCSTI